MQTNPYKTPLSSLTYISATAKLNDKLSMRYSVASGVILYFIMAGLCSAIFYFTPITISLHLPNLDLKQLNELILSRDWFILYTIYNSLFLTIACAWGAKVTKRLAYIVSLTIGLVVLIISILWSLIFPDLMTILPSWYKIINALIIIPAALVGALISNLLYSFNS